jgi:hypothetical protein
MTLNTQDDQHSLDDYRIKCIDQESAKLTLAS